MHGLDPLPSADDDVQRCGRVVDTQDRCVGLVQNHHRRVKVKD